MIFKPSYSFHALTTYFQPPTSQVPVLQELYELTHHLEVADLALHGISVDLTHVPAPIRLPYLSDVQVPCPVVTVRHADPVILRDHVTSDRQNGLRVYA